MDVYLPAEFLLLKDELNDWRDAGSANGTVERAPGDAEAATNGCVDPSWRVF
jgi:hypothetical protein